MKRALLLIVVPALLVTLGFAQTPAASINTDQTNIKGCLGGSDGNYTFVEDNTGHILKITTSSVDLKPHVGHDVTLIGQRESGVSSGDADNSFAVTELNMISEHCTAAAAVPAAAPAATISTPVGTGVTPAVSAVPAVPISTPVETAVSPATTASMSSEAVSATAATPTVTVTTPAETASTPVASAVATVTTPAETSSAPAAPAAHPARLPARPRNPSEIPAAAATAPAATASTSSETVSPPAAAAASTPDATTNTSPETVSTPAEAATKPVAPSKGGFPLWLLISFAMLIIVIGTTTPLFGRWRRRKLLERTGAQNLSLTHESSSDQDKTEQPAIRKAA